MQRPTKLSSIIGQKSAKDRISILLKVAQIKNSSFPHSIMIGGAGLGKSTFAFVIANEIGSRCTILNGANLTSRKEIFPIILSVKFGDIIFIDEIHRVNKKVQEILYPVMEDFRLDFVKSFNLPKHTILGATTDYGLLTKPFRDRFVHTFILDKYTHDELIQILRNNITCIKFDDDALFDITKRSRGTPRIALNYFKWISDFVLAKQNYLVTIKEVREAMTMIGVDERGLNDNDRRYLNLLSKINKPVGVKTISASLNIDVETLENTIEPYLLELGLILKTSCGRILCQD